MKEITKIGSWQKLLTIGMSWFCSLSKSPRFKSSWFSDGACNCKREQDWLLPLLHWASKQVLVGTHNFIFAIIYILPQADFHNVTWKFIIVLNEDFSSSSQEGDWQKAMQSKLQEGGLQDGQLHLGCIYRSVAYISGIKEERQLRNARKLNYISNFMKF